MQLLDEFLQVLFPPRCFHCDAPPARFRDLLCQVCEARLPLVNETDPLWMEAVARCRSGGEISDLRTLYVFESHGPVQSLIHALKYDRMRRVGKELGLRLGAVIQPATVPSVLVPVPLHRSRERERGYNQSAVICEGVGVATGIPVLARALRRVRRTQTQTALSAAERKENIAGAFALTVEVRDAVRGRRVLLVDDVITTGSTIREAAAILRESGVADVVACSIALADHRNL